MALTGKRALRRVLVPILSVYSRNTKVVTKTVRHESTESKYSNGESPSSEEQHARPKENVEEIKEKILLAALEHVPQHGWTKRAIAEGAEHTGYVGVSSGLFGSGADLVHFFNERSNYQLDEDLKKLDIKKPKSSAMIKQAIELRLRMIEPFLPHWSQAQSYLLRPSNMWKASQNLRHLLDIISNHAGLQSADMTWYSRRATLAAVYKSTELAFIADKSPNFADTWSFLDRRIKDFDDYESCESMVCNSGDVLRGGSITFTCPLSTAIVTVRQDKQWEKAEIGLFVHPSLAFSLTTVGTMKELQISHLMEPPPNNLPSIENMVDGWPKSPVGKVRLPKFHSSLGSLPQEDLFVYNLPEPLIIFSSSTLASTGIMCLLGPSGWQFLPDTELTTSIKHVDVHSQSTQTLTDSISANTYLSSTSRNVAPRTQTQPLQEKQQKVEPSNCKNNNVIPQNSELHQNRTRLTPFPGQKRAHSVAEFSEKRPDHTTDHTCPEKIRLTDSSQQSRSPRLTFMAQRSEIYSRRQHGEPVHPDMSPDCAMDHRQEKIHSQQTQSHRPNFIAHRSESYPQQEGRAPENSGIGPNYMMDHSQDNIHLTDYKHEYRMPQYSNYEQPPDPSPRLSTTSFATQKTEDYPGSTSPKLDLKKKPEVLSRKIHRLPEHVNTGSMDSRKPKLPPRVLSPSSKLTFMTQKRAAYPRKEHLLLEEPDADSNNALMDDHESRISQRFDYALPPDPVQLSSSPKLASSAQKSNELSLTPNLALSAQKPKPYLLEASQQCDIEPDHIRSKIHVTDYQHETRMSEIVKSGPSSTQLPSPRPALWAQKQKPYPLREHILPDDTLRHNRAKIHKTDDQSSVYDMLPIPPDYPPSPRLPLIAQKPKIYPSSGLQHSDLNPEQGIGREPVKTSLPERQQSVSKRRSGHGGWPRENIDGKWVPIVKPCLLKGIGCNDYAHCRKCNRHHIHPEVCPVLTGRL